MSERKMYVYEDELLWVKDIATKAKMSSKRLYKMLLDVPVGTDITSIVQEVRITPRYKKFIVFDKLMPPQEISVAYKINYVTLSQRLADVPDGTDITDMVRRYELGGDWYIYHGERVIKKYLVDIVGDYTILDRIFRKFDVKPYDDVTEYVDSYKKRKIDKYKVYDEFLTVSEIGVKYDRVPDTIRYNIRKQHRHPGDDITDLVCDRPDTGKVLRIFSELTGDTDIAGITPVTMKNIYTFLGLKARSGDVFKLTPQFLETRNYEGRKALGFDRASRSRWLTDDLWEYTCPVCGKKLVLTTAQIVAHEHGSMCEDSVEDLLNAEKLYIPIQE